jgi:Domain of unknown function (DUF4865)
MDLLQYSFTLDPGFSMAAIRERVAMKRHLLDALPGFRWKAWLLSETLPGRTQPKSYAPLYLFDEPQAVHAFLCGDLYQAVTDAFGWTRPYHGHAMGHPASSIAGASSCSLTISSVDDHAALRRALAAPGGPPAPSQLQPDIGTALATVRQFDISRMQLRSYTFWTCEAAALAEVDADRVYEVVAVSSSSQTR